MTLAQFKSNFTWDFSKQKIVNCECYLETCIQRKIHVFDFVERNSFIEIQICNTVVKLLYQNINPYDYLYHDFIESIIDDYYKEVHGIEIVNSRLAHSKNILENKVRFTTCDKPLIISDITIKQAFNLILDNKSLTYSDCFIGEITKSVEYFFKVQNYKYNKTLQGQIGIELKRLRNAVKNKVDVEIINIVNKILELTIKNNKL
jgi:hypothetical protein